MAEEVQTGGIMSFRRFGEQQPALDPKRKKDIDEAYAAYYERKEEEKRRRRIRWIIGIIFLILIIGIYFLVK
ncbi:MAG: hypothetical protein AABX07_01065 [Nanoarchaeota archaeon]